MPTDLFDCWLCRDLAQETSICDSDNDVHYVRKQPETEDELERVVEAMDSCPTGAIRYMAVPTEE